MKKQRLLKLADHLEREDIGLDKFDYSRYADLIDERGEILYRYLGEFDISEFAKRNHCGTCGCAVGALPHVFPKYWRFNGDIPEIKEKMCLLNLTSDMVADFFGFELKDYEFLFEPAADINPLYESATAKQVADHIRKFVEHGGIYTKP